MKLLILLVFVVFCGIKNAITLRNVRVIFPEAVTEGNNANLLCLYDLEGDQLYSLKWYRGNREIFRYLPNEMPKMRTFPLPGLYIDEKLSNSHKLTLIDVPRYLKGNFSCEVSTDAPIYATRFVTEYLQVIPKNITQEHLENLNESYTKSLFPSNYNNNEELYEDKISRNSSNKIHLRCKIYMLIVFIYVFIYKI